MQPTARSRRRSAALEAFRFDDYAAACYRFTWDTFCDWFVEFAKPVLAEGDTAAAAEVRVTAGYVLGTLLRLLHPAMPFVTEELWDRFGYGEPNSLIRASWPEPAAVPDALGRARRTRLGGAADLRGTLGAHRDERAARQADADPAA